MFENKLASERTLSFAVLPPGLVAGDYYNGKAAASTVTTAIDKTKAGEGAAVPVQHYRRALVEVITGDIGSGLLGTVKAYLGSISQKADGASMYEIPDFLISYSDTSDNKRFLGEIDLRGIVPTTTLVAGEGLGLWIRHNGTGVNIAANVTLFDGDIEPSGDTLTTGAPVDILP